jgi:hypothetical protein
VGRSVCVCVCLCVCVCVCVCVCEINGCNLVHGRSHELIRAVSKTSERQHQRIHAICIKGGKEPVTQGEIAFHCRHN